ncbi:Unknown protein [Striga hermonthica]|uniref:DUF4283 domain-containing protein n=1 Tax=Striga hermonthica TaxID=68872 RepID=A0A9N7RAQ9_STRHE|nr:Unknown protein [Striga hermonthica]
MDSDLGIDTAMEIPVTGRPLDKSPNTPLLFNGAKPSFRDITLLSKPLPPPPQKRDLFKEQKAKIKLIDNDRLKPVLELDPEYYASVCRPYEDGLVVRLLGKRVSYFYMKEGLKRLWKPHGHLELIDLANGFFMVKFTREDDRDTALNGGPWMLSGHYVTVQKWTPQFNSFNDVIENTLVWIRFSELNIAMFDENIMFCLASMVGTPIRIDLNTSNVERGKRSGKPNKNAGKGEASSVRRAVHKEPVMEKANSQKQVKPSTSNRSNKEGPGSSRKAIQTHRVPLVENEQTHASAKKRRHIGIDKGAVPKQTQDVTSTSKGFILANKFECLNPKAGDICRDMGMEVEDTNEGQDLEAHSRPPDVITGDRI